LRFTGDISDTGIGPKSGGKRGDLVQHIDEWNQVCIAGHGEIEKGGLLASPALDGHYVVSLPSVDFLIEAPQVALLALVPDMSLIPLRSPAINSSP
jgi:hypothetical protein